MPCVMWHMSCHVSSSSDGFEPYRVFFVLVTGKQSSLNSCWGRFPKKKRLKKWTGGSLWGGGVSENRGAIHFFFKHFYGCKFQTLSTGFGQVVQDKSQFYWIFLNPMYLRILSPFLGGQKVLRIFFLSEKRLQTVYFLKRGGGL